MVLQWQRIRSVAHLWQIDWQIDWLMIDCRAVENNGNKFDQYLIDIEWEWLMIDWLIDDNGRAVKEIYNFFFLFRSLEFHWRQKKNQDHEDSK